MLETRSIPAATLLACALLIVMNDAEAMQADTSGAPLQAALQSQDQLQQLVAPIALYPDSLIAQILSAASHPEEIVKAQQWLTVRAGASPSSIAPQADAQPWDPSVKALVQFPAVLANMNRNLAWTSELGDAYINQPGDVSQAIQTMRSRAKQSGTLKTTAQEKVMTKGTTIVIEPAAPSVVYVPQYNPWLAYGSPLAAFPGWYSYPGLYIDGPGISFGLGLDIGLFAGFGWGWHGWGYDWRHGGSVIYQHNTYISHSRTIVNRHDFGSHAGFSLQRHLGGSRGWEGRRAFEAPSPHHGVFGGFKEGGAEHMSSFRGASSFGGFHGGHVGGRR